MAPQNLLQKKCLFKVMPTLAGEKPASVVFGMEMWLAAAEVLCLYLCASVKKVWYTITDARMTRFWISLEHGVRFVIRCLEDMHGGEVFVPKIPSMTVADLAKAVAPDARINVIGIRPGEKLHEVLISEDEARTVIELNDMYVVQPAEALWFGHDWAKIGKPISDEFRYASNTNNEWLNVDQIKTSLSQLNWTSRSRIFSMRILVTGASGLLGLNLCLNLINDHQIFAVLHSQKLLKPPFKTIENDLIDEDSFEFLIKKSKPDLLIHCAAMANVDTCETYPQLAKRVNGEMPGMLAALCREKGIRLIHISTDAVFDGKMGDYTEEDTPNPLSVYAQTKLEGERMVAAEYPDAIIARVNFYGFSLSGKRSLAEFFLNSLKSNKKVDGFVDVMFCPLYVTDLVFTLMKMVAKELKGLISCSLSRISK